MRFFSKVTFICNCCFIIAVILRWVELNRRAVGNYNGAIKFQPLEATLVILGYGAIIINFIFLCFYLFSMMKSKYQPISIWIVLFNALVFPFQVYFFFFS